MPKRVSHSLLDPVLTQPLKALYRRLPIPAAFPPEWIVVAGHLWAIAAAARFGPTEFKSLLIAFGVVMSAGWGSGWLARNAATQLAFWFILLMFLAGLAQLKISLWRAIRDVNAQGAPPDTTEWDLRD